MTMTLGGTRAVDPLGRALRGAAVGALLGALVAGAIAAIQAVSEAGRCGKGWGCLGLFVLVVFSAPVVCGLLSWPLLRLAGVRPAWQVSGMAVLVILIAARVYVLATARRPFESWPELVLFVAGCFGLTAFLLTPGLPPRARLRVLLPVVLLPLGYLLLTGRIAYLL
ncbi:hypothetical protein AB0K51_01630 [Kitasatospora sp. NPDC049285]|uniref:hypothetical protein n=1 Tax=Kitasatospora sp. NPDC049285 TaxID=3157096 RepID=UPI00343478CD